MIDFESTEDGKYYCFQATDQLEQSSYLSVLVDLRPPLITIEQKGSILTATSDKYIKNPWMVGPLAENEFEDCVDVFAKDENGHHNQLWWQRGERTTTVNLEGIPDVAGKYYCIEIEDWFGNTSIAEFEVLADVLEDQQQVEPESV